MKKLYALLLFTLYATSASFAQTNTWIPAASMPAGRFDHADALLPDGTVLISGGFISVLNSVATTIIYNPAIDSWSGGVSMSVRRATHASTRLANGSILVAGGRIDSGPALNSAEIYNPAAGSWAPSQSMSISRRRAAASLLQNGKVLVTGGTTGSDSYITNLTTSCELYDPVTDTWSIANLMNTARSSHTATLLPNGKVLVTGGYVTSVSPYETGSTELYDPVSNSWAIAAPMNASRANHKAVLLTNGMVLVMGGSLDGSNGTLNSCEIYDPVANTWSAAVSLPDNRAIHTATLLPSGNVFVTGGYSGSGVLASTLIFDIAPSLTNVQVTTPAFCGQSVTLTATTSYTSGSYSYTITDGTTPVLSGTATGTAFNRSFTPSGSGPKTYALTIETEYARVSAAAPAIQIPPAAVTLSASNSAVLSCTNASLTLTATATGGSNYTYTFSGAGLAASPSGLSTVAVSQAGTYSVTVQSTGGCPASATISVSGSTTAVGPVTVAASGCAPNNVTLTASSTGATAYTLLPAGNSNGNGVFLVSSAGVYTVIAGNGVAGCQSETTVTVGQGTNAVAGTISVSGPASCASAARLTAAATGQKFTFTGPNGYVFSNVYRNTGSYSLFAEGIKTGGTYTLTVDGSPGCPSATSTIVVQGPDSCPQQ